MKRVVISEDFREFEIHPPELFDRYREIIKKELQSKIKDWDFFDINCPACNSEKKKMVFNKFGMDYVECEKCKTLYVNPRPSEKEVSNYYRRSKAISYWREHLYKETILDRKKIIFGPRALWLVNLTENYFKNPKQFVDVRSKYAEFIEKIIKFDLFQNKIILDPIIDMETLFMGEKRLKIINKPIEALSREEIHADVISAFEVIDRVSNPKKFLKNIRSILVEDGLLFLTTSTISGFDLQVLWRQSKSIFPLDHMNIFSIEGLTELITCCGFEIIELSTPGQLDLEIVKNAARANSDLKLPRFVSYLIEKRDENVHRAFQDFLQRYNLSSHVRIAVKKN